MYKQKINTHRLNLKLIAIHSKNTLFLGLKLKVGLTEYKILSQQRLLQEIRICYAQNYPEIQKRKPPS